MVKSIISALIRIAIAYAAGTYIHDKYIAPRRKAKSATKSPDYCKTCCFKSSGKCGSFAFCNPNYETNWDNQEGDDWADESDENIGATCNSPADEDNGDTGNVPAGEADEND